MDNLLNLNKRNKEIFIKNVNDVKDDYILFNQSIVSIGDVSSEYKLGQLVSFKLSTDKLKINFNNIEKAYFYYHYYFNKGIKQLLESDDYNKYQFLIFYKNKLPYLDLEINLYVKKKYLLNLYEKNFIPEMINLIINKKWKDLTLPKYKQYELIPHLNENTESINCDKFLKINLFNYQKNNVLWMENMENKTNIHKNNISFINFKNYNRYYIKSIDEYLYNYNNKLLNLSKNQDCIVNLKFNGGILCDEVGLGKTLSMISLILQNPKLYQDNKSKATLIICPNRLCLQWFDEINIYLKNNNLKILKLLTIRNYKKYTLEDYLNADIVLMGFKFMANKRYLDLEKSKLRLDDIFWHRIIVDEGHELLIDKRFGRKNNRQMKETLYKFKSKYKWICSGTPLGELETSLIGIIKFICVNFDDIKYNTDLINIYSRKFINHLFRFNNKESIKNEIVIPPIKEAVIFLKQTKIERAIYNSMKGNALQMIQLCTHVLISEYNNILDGELNLNKLQHIMLSFFNKKIVKINKTIMNFKIKLEKNDNKDEIQDKINKYTLNLRNLNYKKKIFENLDKNYDDITKEMCPITKCEMDEPVVTLCGHYFDKESIEYSLESLGNWCPLCKTKLTKNDYYPIIKEDDQSDVISTSVNKYGTKMAYLINFLNELIEKNNRIIIFTQWDKMLKLVGNVLKDNNINYVTIKGNTYVMANRIRKFKLDNNIKVILLSSDSCSSGSNLTEASQIILLDTINETKENAKIIEQQAIGRASRIGQNKEVVVTRIIMENTIEHEYYTRNTL